jgi:hypothetical protein
MRLDLWCHKVGSPQEESYAARTVDVSAGGVFFESGYHPFEAGDVLRVEMSVPATTGFLEGGGRIFGMARVLRIRKPCSEKELGGGGYSAALEFCEPPKLYT